MKRVLALTLAAAVCGTLAASATSATTRTIKVGDNYFFRSTGVPTVTVTVNTRVTWRWAGESAHDVRVSSGPIKFKSKIQETGTYSRTMTRRGTYKIFCEVHGASDQSMVLRVR